MKIMDSISNDLWYRNVEKLISIIMPVYNRRDIVGRAISSVINQKSYNFEFIIVDDGSDQMNDLTDIIGDLMQKANFPILFVRKENGGVHTARNCGIKQARGTLIYFLDSDDEIVCTATENIESIYFNSIKQSKAYVGIITKCFDDYGKVIGRPWRKSDEKKVNNTQNFEANVVLLTQVLKENMWIEPEGVTFVLEGILWEFLFGYKKYKLVHSECVTRIYHKDLEDGSNLSLKCNTKSIQNVKNSYWECFYMLDNADIYLNKVIKKWFTLFRGMIMWNILRSEGEESFIEKYTIVSNNIVINCCALIASKIYRRTRIVINQN